MSYVRRAFAPLANAPSQLRPRYDAVILGSGYGGSVLAARLAAAGRSVCVLERGREWLPGEFPSDEPSLLAAIRSPVNPLGLIDPNMQLRNDLDVVVGSGLGGTSLINAGISLRPEDTVLQAPEWPLALRRAHAAGELARFYELAERMLGAVPTPDAARLGKVRAHKHSLASGARHGALSLNVNHGKDASRAACTLCGDCVSGCNVGAKNSLWATYLPLAKRAGAELYTGLEARALEKNPFDGTYTVHFHRRGALSMHPHGSVEAPLVVLSAGSLGSTELLLRSMGGPLRLSRTVGTRFSGNADLLGVSYNGAARTDSLGRAHEPGSFPAGPTIASFSDFRDASRALEERFVLLEGAFPTAVAGLLARSLGAWAMLHALRFSHEQRLRTLRDLRPLLATSPKGALNHSLLFLACGHDSAAGRLELDAPEGRVRVEWPGVDKERAFAAITEEMQRCAERQGGVFVPNPRSTVLGGQRQMTVHPLGGCPMGDDADRGTVDHLGRVFDGEGGVHAGLLVADGSVVPRSLGVTPLLTITALAERIAQHAAAPPV